MKKRARKSTTRAFTLIELMLVIGVMAILAGATAMALAQAMEQGRVSRTQAQIARIHGLLMTRYDSYRTRSLRLAFLPTDTAQDRAIKKLFAIRELMRLEMPERCHDIRHFSVTAPGTVENQITLLAAPTPLSGIARPALANNYFRKIGDNKKFFLSQNRTNESSECLYLILSTINDGDTSGIDFLLPSEIGDSDGDGVPEILDSWGTPVYFLRWAPGLVSPIQNQTDPDPFDVLRVDSVRPIDTLNPFLLTPFVASAGPDRILGMAISKAEANPSNPTEFYDHPHDFSDPLQNNYNYVNDPYCIPKVTTAYFGGDSSPLTFPRFGSELNRDSMADNILNHFLSQK